MLHQGVAADHQRQGAPFSPPACPPACPPARNLRSFLFLLPCLLTHLPAYLQVRPQHNHSDCGLYMLRYIELLSQHRTPLCAKWKAAPTKHQRDDNELKFSDHSIDEKRGEMCAEIRTLGAEQQRAKKEAEDLEEGFRRSMEPGTAGGPS